jgi:hypothetical protein
MVTENKQAMYHQNKTQAYYIARSGAEVVEEAILQLAKKEDKSDANDLLDAIPESPLYNPISYASQMEADLPDEIIPDNGDINVYLTKEFKGTQKAAIIITSVAEVGGVSVELQKELPVPLEIAVGEEVAGINYISGISPAEAIWKGKKITVSQVSSDDYSVEAIDPPSFEDVLVDVDNENVNGYQSLGSLMSISSGNYYVDGNSNWSNDSIFIDGDVNIYVRDFMDITDLDISGSPNSNLNIYIYGTTTYDGKSLYTGDKSTNSISGDVNTKFHVSSGDIYLNFFQGKNEFFDADLYAGSGVGKIELNAHSNSGHPNMIGKVYAPESIVYIGSDSGDDQASFTLEGSILADRVVYQAKNNQYNQLGKKFQINTTGIDQDEIDESLVFTSINEGFYR